MQLAPLGFTGTSHVGHFCLPYDSAEEDRTAVVGFLRDGLAREQRCMVVGTDDEHERLMHALVAAGVSATRARERGALVLASRAQTYHRTGRFDAHDMLALLDELISGALRDGFTGFRGTSQLAGPVPETAWPELIWYEAQLNERFARRPFAALCRYPRAAVPAALVGEMLRTHPTACVRGELCENPFFERADLAVSDDPQARLDWRLHQLRVYQRARERQREMTGSLIAEVERLSSELRLARGDGGVG
jgi:hypothetical protein